MIDWLTLKTPLIDLDDSVRVVLQRLNGRIMKISKEGEVEWMTPARESIRSDSHQVSIRVATDIEICGSPARVLHKDNVFGSGDIVFCASAMIGFVEGQLGVSLPHEADRWKVSRIDITHNYDLGSSAEVRQALAFLRHSEGGRYQVRTSSESVYFNAGSRMRSGKAYHKGPHLAYQMKKRQAEFTALELSLAERLLRLELSLRSQWWHRSRQDWYDLNETQLDRIHADYFDQFIGKVEVVEMDNLLQSLEKVSETKGQALSAYRTWSLVKSIGVREAQASMPDRTWRRHKKLLFDAGLTWADLQMSNVVPLRRRPILLGAPVRSWDELIAKAA